MKGGTLKEKELQEKVPSTRMDKVGTKKNEPASNRKRKESYQV